MKVYTSNIFLIIVTIDTATSGPIERATIGSAAGTSSNIDTIPIATFKITITIATITITISIIITSATSVIIKITSDTGAATLESEIIPIEIIISIISITQTIQIRIILARTEVVWIIHIKTELAEWVGFNKFNKYDNFDYQLMTGKIK